MRVLLISTYDLGRQPFGLASPAAWLKRAGAEVECVDTSRDPLTDDRVSRADLVAFYLPMHTATRLAMPLIERVRVLNPSARLAAYGLYAPLNAEWLRTRGVQHVLGPEAEQDLVSLIEQTAADVPPAAAQSIPRLRFIQPERAPLPPLQRYAALQMPDGTRRVVGSTDATRGCKHLCRHCPIVPVYQGAFRVVAVDTVIEDIRAQVAAGAQHITFGDPDFLNGPAHARRVVEQLSRECPGLTYDVTIKIEHLLAHRAMLPLLRDTGCLFITSAVESVDDVVLEKLRKGHTRADFAAAVEACRDAGVTLVPTFVAFTPWTTIDGYIDLLDAIESLGLIETVAPIQLGIRLLVTADSRLLELPDIRDVVAPFDAQSLTYPWRHRDERVDALQADVMQIVSGRGSSARAHVFDAVREHAERARGGRVAATASPRVRTPGVTPPYLTEGWYCCAEPGPEQLEIL